MQNKIDYNEIDEQLKQLIKELNKVGLKTYGSCCGHNKETAYLNLDFRYIESISVRNAVDEEGELKPFLQIEWRITK